MGSACGHGGRLASSVGRRGAVGTVLGTAVGMTLGMTLGPALEHGAGPGWRVGSAVAVRGCARAVWCGAGAGVLRMPRGERRCSDQLLYTSGGGRAALGEAAAPRCVRCDAKASGVGGYRHLRVPLFKLGKYGVQPLDTVYFSREHLYAAPLA
jgi:hypothetical protein